MEWGKKFGKLSHPRESFDRVTIYYSLKIFQDLRTHTPTIPHIHIWIHKNAWHYNQLLTLYPVKFTIWNSIPSQIWHYKRFGTVSDDTIRDIYCIKLTSPGGRVCWTILDQRPKGHVSCFLPIPENKRSSFCRRCMIHNYLTHLSIPLRLQLFRNGPEE